MFGNSWVSRISRNSITGSDMPSALGLVFPLYLVIRQLFAFEVDDGNTELIYSGNKEKPIIPGAANVLSFYQFSVTNRL